MKNKSVIIFLIVVLIVPAALFASSAKNVITWVLPGAEAQNADTPSEPVKEDFSYLNGYDKVSRSVKASGFGKTVSSALTDSHKRLVAEIEDQLIYRMNRFTISTLTDMSDYVRYYAVNRNKIISLIALSAETKNVEQMKYGYVITREVSRANFEDVFKKFISSATEQMNIDSETANVANNQLNELTGAFKDKDPVVFTFIDGKLQ